MPATTVVETGGARGTDTKNVLGLKGKPSPGLGTEGDYASLAVGWVAVLFFRSGALQGQTVCRSGEVRSVARFPRVPDGDVEINAGKLGQPGDVDVEVSFCKCGCEAGGVYFLPNGSAGLFENVAPSFYNAAVPVIATRAAWTGNGMVCFERVTTALFFAGVPIHAMGRGVGGEAEAPLECSAKGVVAEVGALVGQRCGEAGASSEAGCAAEPNSVSWG